MAIFSFFKPPKNQSFDYKPRYWDPQKEELETRLKKAELRKEDTIAASKARIANRLRRGNAPYDPRLRQQEVRKANLRLLFIIVLLGFLAYILLNVYLPEIEEALR